MKPKTLLQYFEWYLPAERGPLEARRRRRGGTCGRRALRACGCRRPTRGRRGAATWAMAYTTCTTWGNSTGRGQRARQVSAQRAEYLAAVRALQGQGLAVLADVVLNHRMGADACEPVDAEACDPGDRRRETGRSAIPAWTKFTFPGRGRQVFRLSVEPHAL